MARYQTMTVEEQDKILELIDEARAILRKQGLPNNQRLELIDKLSSLFHDVQTTNTQEL